MADIFGRVNQDAWAASFGDPNDPDVQAKIAAAVEELKQQGSPLPSVALEMTDGNFSLLIDGKPLPIKMLRRVIIDVDAESMVPLVELHFNPGALSVQSIINNIRVSDQENE